VFSVLVRKIAAHSRLQIHGTPRGLRSEHHGHYTDSSIPGTCRYNQWRIARNVNWGPCLTPFFLFHSSFVFFSFPVFSFSPFLLPSSFFLFPLLIFFLFFSFFPVAFFLSFLSLIFLFPLLFFLPTFFCLLTFSHHLFHFLPFFFLPCLFPWASPAGPGRSFSRNWIWCIMALKYEIWWQQFWLLSLVSNIYFQHTKMILDEGG